MPTDNKQLSDLTAAGTLDGTELLLITQGGNSRKIDLATLVSYITTAGSIVPSSNAWRGARARRTTNLTTVPNNSTITWESTALDSDSFWSAGAPTRLTVPTGIQKVRLRWGVLAESLTVVGSVVCLLYKNGSSDIGEGFAYTAPRNGSSGFADNTANGFSGVLEVSAGDYFELQWFANMSGQDTVLANSWFEIEVVEALP